MQDAVIRLKVRRGAAAHNLENRGDRPLTRSKDRASHQDFHVLPNRSGKTGAKTPMTLLHVIGKESMTILSR
ncbi:MAG: hypothetical protein V3U27_09250 [Candidatus Tectomicrobia bacterium]